MFYSVLELTKRYHEISVEIDALAIVHKDMKTLNASKGANRSAIRETIDDLRYERGKIEGALRDLDKVEVK